MDMMPLIIVTVGGALILGMIALAFAGPSPQRAQARRIGALRERHGDSAVAVDAKLRRITNSRDTRMDVAVGRLLPNRAALAKRLAMTGKDWTVGNYGMATVQSLP
ncbi:MAG: pilus assembly protein TadB, partial [Sphingomonas sp.]